jgi:nitric-oxide synthase
MCRCGAASPARLFAGRALTARAGGGAQGACYGCGVRVQLLRPDAPGYVAPDKYAPKATHRQLDQLLCGRCAELAHGRLVNAVAGQGSAATRAANLVSPEQLRTHLTALKARKVLVVLLVDALDFSGSFLPRLRDAVGANPVLLVVTKADLLPSGAEPGALADWIEAEVGYRRLTLLGLHLVSAKRGDGMRAAVGAMASLRAGRDVVVVGAANVGKSSFIRAALAAMRAGGDASAPGRRLPVASAMPGTTLGVIPLRAFRGEGVLYDTPGVVLHHRVNGMLDGGELAALAQRGPVRPREAPPPLARDGAQLLPDAPRGCAFFWEGLVRVDVLEAPPGARLLFWGPEAMRVAALRLADADAGATPWDRLPGAEGGEEEEEGGDAAAAEADADAEAEARGAAEQGGPAAPPQRRRGARNGPALGAAAVAARGGLRMVRELELTAGTRMAPLADIAISGLGGWVTLVAGAGGRGGVGAAARCTLRVWVPRGAEVFVRPPMPVQPHGTW